MKIKIELKNKKSKYIYGDMLKNKKAKTLVLFMSGFSGGRNSKLFVNASNVFLKNGFDTLRFNFFQEKGTNNTLRPEEISFSVYASELANIINHFEKRYSRIILVGHSFGTIISILFLNKYRKYIKKIGLVFWEPTLLPWKEKFMKEDFIFDIKKKIYYGKNTKEIMNEIFYQECITTNISKIFHSLNKNTCVFAAKNSADKDATKFSSKPIIIKNTNHFFDGKNAQKELFDKTIKFLR